MKAIKWKKPKKEFNLLQFFLENKGIVLTRETLLDKVWGFDYAGDTNVIDVYIRCPADLADEMRRVGLDMFLTANNHSMDRGVKGQPVKHIQIVV